MKSKRLIAYFKTSLIRYRNDEPSRQFPNHLLQRG